MKIILEKISDGIDLSSLSQEERDRYVLERSNRGIALQQAGAIPSDVVTFMLSNYIKLNWRGAWSSESTYNYNDAVSYLGSSYVALRTTTEQPSESAADWKLIAKKGEDGRGIVSFELIDTQAKTKTYRLLYTDATFVDIDIIDGQDGHTPIKGVDYFDGITPTIGLNKHWFIGAIDTGIVAEGKDGEDGVTPIITIGENENWYINGVDSGKPSRGATGTSAYEIYHAGGGTLSEVDFNASITNIPAHIADTDIHHSSESLSSQFEPKNSNIQDHISSTNNPHSTTKEQVGLGNVDNTSDADKPLSNAETTALNGKVDKETGKGLSQENFTTAEKSKLASLEHSLWLGEYPSLLALQTAHPTGVVGNSAYVDLGAGIPVATYAWDTTDNVWTLQQGESTAETPESIKQKYEINPDTNAFTDDEKSKLSGISSGADVTKDVLTGATTNNTISDSDTFNFIKLIEGVPTLLKTTYAYLKSYLKSYFDTIYSGVNHNHNLNDLAEKNYSSLSDKPDLSSLHSHSNKTDLDNYNPSNFEPAKGADDNYVTDAEKTKLSNLSGTNTGDQDLSSLQLKNLKFTDKVADTWVSDTLYTDYLYRSELTLSGVTSTDIAEVIFAHTQAISGKYSPVCLTGTNKVTIYAKINTTITIPTILINKQS